MDSPLEQRLERWEQKIRALVEIAQTQQMALRSIQETLQGIAETQKKQTQLLQQLVAQGSSNGRARRIA